MTTRITEGSYISIGILLVLAGALFWVGAQGGKVDRNEQDIAILRSEVSAERSARAERDNAILQRLATIETLLQKGPK